jgi:hypothetical protein
VLLGLGGLILLGLLVKKLSVVHDLADRRIGVWRDLNQIQPHFLGPFDSIGGADDSNLFAFFVDQANFRITNEFVDPVLGGLNLGALEEFASGDDRLLNITCCALAEVAGLRACLTLPETLGIVQLPLAD